MEDKKEPTVFDTLSHIDTSKHVEKKMGLSYLSWSWAWAYLKAMYGNDVQKTFTKFPEYDWKSRVLTGRDVDYCKTDTGTYVECTVTIKGHSETETLPVMDYKNKAVMLPDQMQINKTKQRCFVKACALQGLGLNLYAGEDLPVKPAKEEQQNKPNNQRRAPQQRSTSNKPANKPAPQAKVNMAIQLISTYANLNGKDEKEMIQASARKAHVNDLKELNEPQVDEMINGFTKAIELMNDKEGVK